jgi:hypothetical protein
VYVLTWLNSELWSGRSCMIDPHVSIRRDWYELRGMVGGRKCRWVDLGCQPKYCSTYHNIAVRLRNPLLPSIGKPTGVRVNRLHCASLAFGHLNLGMTCSVSKRIEFTTRS